jgi:Flp pilus assembly protein TadD
VPDELTDHLGVGSGAGELERIESLIDLGRYEQADLRLRSFLARDPVSARGWRRLASVSQRLHRPAASLAAARRAVAIAPTSHLSHIVLADALGGIRRWRDAVGAAREAVRLAPNASSAHYTLANVLRRGGHRSRGEAVVEARRAVALDAHDPNCHNLLGLCLRAKGRRTEAFAAFAEGLRLDPENTLILNNLGALRLDRHDPAGAGRAIVSGLRIDAQQETLQRNLGAILMQVALRVAITSYFIAVGIGLITIGEDTYWARALLGVVFLLGEGLYAGRALAAIPRRTRVAVVRASIQRRRRVGIAVGVAVLTVVVATTIAFAPLGISRPVFTGVAISLAPVYAFALLYRLYQVVAWVVDRVRR